MSAAALNERVLDFIARKEASGAVPSGAGLAVAVVKDGEVLFKGGFGLRERDRNLPVTSETIFEICSLTKAFTATALVMASEDRRIDLDRPINSATTLLFFSDPEVSRQVTILDLLTHRTGLPSNDLLWYFGCSREDVFRAIAHLELIPSGFRNVFVYNNLVYGALGHLFGDLIGEAWETRVQRTILAPLGMGSTSFGGAVDSDDVALPYVGTQRVGRANMAAVAAAGAMRSNVEDMARWMALHLNRGKTVDGKQLLSEASVERIQSRQMGVADPNPLIFQGLEWLQERGVSYGLGWFLGSSRGRRALYHPGLVDGFSTALVMFPEERLGLVVLANLNLSNAPGLLIQELTSAVLDRNDTVAARELDPASPKMLAAAGRYDHPVFGTASIVLRGRELVLDYKGHRWPLSWKDDRVAALAVPAFGVQLPLSVQFEMENGKAERLCIAMSLDPRVGPEKFVRRA